MRKRISELFWKRIQHYFPESTELIVTDYEHDGCAACSNKAQSQRYREEKIKTDRMLLLEGSLELNDLLNDKDQKLLIPKPKDKNSPSHIEDGDYRLVPMDWIVMWRAFILCKVLEAPGPCSIDICKCEHEKIVLSPDLMDFFVGTKISVDRDFQNVMLLTKGSLLSLIPHLYSWESFLTISSETIHFDVDAWEILFGVEGSGMAPSVLDGSRYPGIDLDEDLSKHTWEGSICTVSLLRHWNNSNVSIVSHLTSPVQVKVSHSDSIRLAHLEYDPDLCHTCIEVLKENQHHQKKYFTEKELIIRRIKDFPCEKIEEDVIDASKSDNSNKRRSSRIKSNPSSDIKIVCSHHDKITTVLLKIFEVVS